MLYNLVVYFALGFGSTISEPAMLEAPMPNWQECMNRQEEMKASVASHGSYNLLILCVPVPVKNFNEMPN